MNITISREAEGARLLDDPHFRGRWRALCECCPWSTSYQLPAFVLAWYRIYGGKFEPVIVTGRDQVGGLAGILCMAVAGDGELVGAGATQAEYQTWVSRPESAGEFALGAVVALRREFPGRVVEFRYLPPGVPLDWLADPLVRSGAVLTKKPRPLLRFAEMSDDSLNKTNNKKRLKGLKKLGGLDFRKLSGADELAAVFDEFASFYDLRLGAMHGTEPFAQDPLKKQFQLELMKEPGLLHATILKAGDRLASAHINVRDGKQIHLNLVGYNPLLAKHSPGKFHIHMLTQMLIAEGCEEMDLTPGGDPYKERFANAHDTAYVLSFYPTMASRLKGIAHTRAEAWARRGLGALHIHPARARDALADLRSGHLHASVAKRIRNRFSSRQPIKLHPLSIPPKSDQSSPLNGFRRDSIDDLLTYRPNGSGWSRKRFLLDSMNRLEEGQHPYTRVRDGRLVYLGWMIERPSAVFVSRVLPGVELPANHALILALRSYGANNETELESRCLETMLGDLSRTQGIEGTIAIVSSERPSGWRLEPAGRQ
jgi:CelD/BcsL family acetyltransferase involved in cellulose biosynthesis